jgi:hypothetical protein
MLRGCQCYWVGCSSVEKDALRSDLYCQLWQRPAQGVLDDCRDSGLPRKIANGRGCVGGGTVEKGVEGRGITAVAKYKVSAVALLRLPTECSQVHNVTSRGGKRLIMCAAVSVLAGVNLGIDNVGPLSV